MLDRARSPSRPSEEPVDNDTLLAQVLSRVTPKAFRHMPDAEQSWRARMFLMTWVLSHHEVYAWSIALADDPNGDTRHVVESIDDDAILAGLRGVDWRPLQES